MDNTPADTTNHAPSREPGGPKAADDVAKGSGRRTKHKIGSTSARFQKLIEKKLDETDTSVRSATLGTTLNPEALRSVMRGRAPSIDRAEEICRALDIGFHLGKKPGSDQQHTGKEAGAWTPRPAQPRLRVRTLSRTPDLRGHWSEETRPVPDECNDPAVFYVRAPDDGIAPAGILQNDLALIAPGKEPRRGDLAWLVDGTTSEEILGLVIRRTRDGYDVVRWVHDPDKAQPVPIATTHARGDRGRVIGVEQRVVLRKRKPGRPRKLR